MNPRNDAALLALQVENDDGYTCRHHEGVPAAAMWPWKRSDRLCSPCIDNAQAHAESMSERDRARGYPVASGIGTGTLINADDAFLYTARGRSTIQKRDEDETK